MYCTACGTKIQDGMKFCSKCGNNVDDSVNIPDANVQPDVVIKCGNCDYVGAPERARRPVINVLAWLCVFFAPIITILYFAFTHKYRCPKCKSTFVGIKNKEGVFTNQGKSPAMIFLWIIIGIAIFALFASIILASLNTAREKMRQAEQNNTLNQ